MLQHLQASIVSNFSYGMVSISLHSCDLFTQAVPAVGSLVFVYCFAQGQPAFLQLCIQLSHKDHARKRAISLRV